MRHHGSILFLVIAVLMACNSNGPAGLQPDSPKVRVGKSVFHNALTYFVVRNSDTSSLKVSFWRKSDGGIEADIFEASNLSYREELEELKLVLKAVSKDFPLRSLNEIWGVSLIVAGDLTIILTKEFLSEKPNGTIDNSVLQEFLITSGVTADLNALLLPFGKKIKKYIVEKTGFIDTASFFKYNKTDKIETPKSEIPSKVLIADIWPVIEDVGG